VWTVIYIAPNREAAESLKKALEQEGVLVNLRPTGLSTASGGAHVELMVPQGEAREAHGILNDALGRVRFKK